MATASTETMEEPPTYSMCSASKIQQPLPKRYRVKRPGEKSIFNGAGILPVCRYEGELYILLGQPQVGKKAPTVRWFDFGGNKKGVTELPLDCSIRKFAKQTYGAFGLDFNFESPDVLCDIQALYEETCSFPLLLEGAQRWARSQCMMSEESVPLFFNVLEGYHVMILPVPYIASELLDEISMLVDRGKRAFQWLTPGEFSKEALAPRLASTRNLKTALTDLNLNPHFCEEGTYGDFSYHRPTSSLSVHVLTAENSTRDADDGRSGSEVRPRSSLK